MKNKRLAIIDLGTNTFHLLVAEAAGHGYNVVHRERLAVKIGAEGINRGVITDSAVRRALDAVSSFRKTMAQWRVGSTFAFGTSALRNARNGQEVASAIASGAGTEVILIDGDKEAEYIFYGVRAALGLTEQTNLVVDIGGGSVEFIIGNGEGILWKRSFEIGAQRLLERYHKHDPILPTEIQAVESHFDRELVPLRDALLHYNPTVLAGSSGTFDTLSEIYCTRNGIDKSTDDPETPLTIDGFRNIHAALLTADRERRMRIPGMIEMRVDMIVVASCLITYLLDRHAFSQIRVSTWSLKEGVLAYLTIHKTI